MLVVVTMLSHGCCSVVRQGDVAAAIPTSHLINNRSLCHAALDGEIGLMELHQMRHCWMTPNIFAADIGTPDHSVTEVVAGSDGCSHFQINETLKIPSKAGSSQGGSSIYALSTGDELRLCSVLDHFDGHYSVACPSPPAGSCAQLSVTVQYLGCSAYHNTAAGHGSISVHSGGFRKPVNKKILNRKICTASDAATSPPLAPVRKFWRHSPTSGSDELRWFQRPWEWVDSCGLPHRFSNETRERFRSCIGALRSLTFIGSSHLNYNFQCLSRGPEFGFGCPDMKLGGQWRGTFPTHLIHAAGRADAKTISFYEQCGNHPLSCNEGNDGPPKPINSTQLGNGVQRCWAPGVAWRSFAPQTQVCVFASTNLIRSSMMLRLLAMTARVDKPLDARDVFVVQGGAWDGAEQADSASYLKISLSEFMAAVAALRADPVTASARVLLASIPAATQNPTTGWRNNFAIAALNAAMERHAAAQPDLRIEFIDQFSLYWPRYTESAPGDKVHYQKPGDDAVCPGPLGTDWDRVLLDVVCERRCDGSKSLRARFDDGD